MTQVKDGNGNVIGGAKTLAAGTFTATGSSSVVRASNTEVGVRIWGTFVGTVVLKKSYDAGVTWVDVKSYTAAADEIYDEVETADFKLECAAYTSGTVNFRLAVRDFN